MIKGIGDRFQSETKYDRTKMEGGMLDWTKKPEIYKEYPDSEKGKGYLRQGDDLFLYLPTTREFVYRNRKDDIGSTDVRTDIFGKLTNLEKFYCLSLYTFGSIN